MALGGQMNKRSRFVLRSNLSMILILSIVLAGFTLIMIRQKNFRSFEDKIERQVHNIAAKKDLGTLIVNDLGKVATHFYMILFSADEECQQILLGKSQRTIEHIYTALDILSEGGTLSRNFSLNLTDKDNSTFTITYSPQHKQQYNIAVLTLRPQLILLEEKIADTIAITAERNRQLKSPQQNSLATIGSQLRIYAKGIHAQLQRMTENANKLAHDANEEFSIFQTNIDAARIRNQQIDTLWALTTIFCVFGLIALIYRQTASSQRKLEHTVDQLQQTEQELQDTHTEVLALNRSLEQKVIIRTEELNRSEQQWSKAFDAISSPIFIHNKTGRITKANEAYLRQANCTMEQALGQLYWDIFPKLDNPLPGCINETHHDNSKSCAQEMDITINDKVYRSQSFVVNDKQGRYINSMHLLKDITAKSKARMALVESEKRFREVTNSMNEVLILLDTDLKVQMLNDAAIKAYGVDGDYTGKLCHDIFWHCSDICDQCPTLEVFRNGEISSALRYMGDGRILSRTISPVRNDAGEITACAVIATDVTEREKHIQKLTRYEQILSTTTDLIAYYDQDHICLSINNVMAEHYATTPDKLVGKHASEIIGAERYHHYLKYQEIIFKQKKPATFNLWIDFPATGSVHMKVTFTPYIDENGCVAGIVSRLKNITEQTRQEANLRLSAKVFETTTEGITITTKDGTIEMVNPAFCQITGYTQAEAIGQNPRILKSGRHDNAYYQQMWEELAETDQWQGEIWNKRKNGDIYPEWLSISTLRDEHGDISHYIATFSDLTRINSVVQKLEHQAHHHALTGLPNRLLLHARLDHSIQQAARQQQQGAVFYIDLDNFKHINDSLGHAAGDEVLLSMAKRLKEHCRDVDTIAHLSGDEFVLVLDAIRSVHDAVARAEQLLLQLSQPIMVQDYELVTTSSIGVTIFPDDGTDIDTLLKNSDVAMQKAKDSGKNKYHLYSPELTVAAFERIMLETNLRRALEKEEFVLYYQPQILLPHGEIVACEALVRWQHHDMGLIPPDKFIPLSEETGLIIPMGEWILRTACKQWVSWDNQGLGLRKIAVNLSGRQIQQKDLPQMIERVLSETKCPATALELEITESFMMQQPEEAIAVLHQLRDLGIELSIDDFGTGHSSLSYLKRFPIHRLKIDRSFISDMEHNADDHAIVKTIIAMGHSLNLKITAEGIETEEQKTSLAELHCDEAQGYLFSKPIPADEFAKLLQLSTT